MVKHRRRLQRRRRLERLGAPGVQDSLGYLEGLEALGDQRGLGFPDYLSFQVGLIGLPPQQVLDTQ